ncbi:MAG: hypothetical protein IT349_13415 [Candidatus Eisenbacteria bacterium]|nr:hypothetical protein [Candidatus Eisenbacteria bacterium]
MKPIHHSSWRRRVLAPALLCTLPSLVQAGANEGGCLLFHANPELVYTSDVGNYAGLAGVGSCAEVTSRVDGIGSHIVHLLAAFPENVRPQVAALEFGLTYDAEKLEIVVARHEGDLEIQTADWPASGSGVALTFLLPREAAVNEVYWFVVYAASEEPTELRLAEAWGRPPGFADHSLLSVVDPVVGLGVLGINRDGVTPCPGVGAPHGACCLPSGRCEQMSNAECEVARGAYLGDGVLCEVRLCYDQLHCCTDTGCLPLSKAECTSQGGTFTERPCLQAECLQLPSGGCCNQGQCRALLREVCEEYGGVYLGDDISCTPEICPSVLGACCAPSFGCHQLSEERCHQERGEFRGVGTRCNPDLCPRDQRLGACCWQELGACLLSIEAECVEPGKLWKGYDVDCDPNPCPPVIGACCFVDGTCRVVSGVECLSPLPRGTFLGGGSTCDPMPCAPPPTGACCLSAGGCVVIDAFSCSMRGSYLGDSTRCEVGTCVGRDNLPTEKSHWGEIKRRYER